ncbi:MAG TPA: T9SS type A sorting domain-containing protein [Bacteroidota bacterium]|nr:T9SS type A sorting domain-containing protein [Bacteroidota bacterium]
MYTRQVAAFLLLSFIFCGSLSAQTHFRFASQTGNNATVAVPLAANPNINGTPLAPGDEIGVFTPSGLCVGAVVWNGANVAITVWGDNDQTTEIDGMRAGEIINYHVWRQSTNTEYASVSVTYSLGDGIYTPNALYTLSSLNATAPPAPPTLASPTNSATGLPVSITFFWNAVSFASVYQLQVSADSTFATLAVNADGLTDSSFSNGNLGHYTTYFWRVRASNSGGPSEWSRVWSFRTILAAPFLQTPANGSRGQPLSLALRWNPTPGATAYRVQVSTNSTFSSMILNDSSLTTPSTAIASLQNNTIYFWRVNARNTEGTSAWSEVWSFKTILPTPALLAPSNESTDQPTTPTLSWSSSPEATSYHLQLSSSASFSPSVFEDSTLTVTSRSVGPLANSATYFWRVRAKNSEGITNWSTTWSYTTVPPPPPGPLLASPSNEAIGQSTTTTLRWNAATGATHYRFQLSTSPSFASIVLDDSTLTTTSFETSSLQNATKYYWRVLARNSGGSSNWSDVWEFTTIGSPMTHGIRLFQGWNMISSYVGPQDSSLDGLTSTIRPNMVIVKNGMGEVYWPVFNINTVGDWNYRHGYQVYMQAADTLPIPGNELIPTLEPLPLIQGWNLIGYLRNSPLVIDSALATIARQLVIVKNNSGQVFWPEFGINTIGSMMPGQGYQVYLSQASALTYPANSQSSSGNTLTKSVAANPSAPVYFRVAGNTGNNATVALPRTADPKVGNTLLVAGDEIGVFNSEGLCIGAAVWTGSNTAITIWGDNEMTTTREGMQVGEEMEYRVWQRETNQEFKNITVSYSRGNARYAPDGIYVLSTFQMTGTTETEASRVHPTEFGLDQNFPNPFNPTTIISYQLPTRVPVRLVVFNIIGQEVAVLVNTEQEAGSYRIVFDSSSLPGGVYLYRLTAGDFRQTKRMILLR